MQCPWGYGDHLAGTSGSASSLFLLPGEERFHISGLTDAVKLQTGPGLNQPQMGHPLLPGGGKSNSSPTDLRGAG